MPMTLIQAVILAAIQGITEFLPISSSAHLVVLPTIFGWNELIQSNYQLSFDIALHFGSIIALIVYFRNDLLSIIKSLKPGNNKNLLLMIIVGSIPAFIAGVLFKEYIEKLFKSPLSASVLLIVTGVILFTAERINKEQERKAEDVDYKNALIIGAGQALALIPGISRSGSTISFGIIQGLKREEAARFSFLLAIPAIFGASVMTLIEGRIIINIQWIAGLMVSVISSFIAIKFLMSYLKLKRLDIFAYYCWIAGTLFIFLIMVGLI